MKRLFTMMLVALPLFATFAQTNSFDTKGKVEINAGYGIATAPDIISGFSNMFTGALLPGVVERIDSEGFGSPFASADYYISNRFAVGLQYNFANYVHHYSLTDESIADLSNRYHTAMVRGKGVWINKPMFQLYSTVAAGPTFVTAKNEMGHVDNKIHFAFHASPVGIRVGNQIAFFVEGGIGFQGLISAGISARF